MGTKERLLTLLQANKGVYFSGEALAAELELSRTAVWKAVNLLRQEGYSIDAVRNRGYCLRAAADPLSAPEILAQLQTKNLDITVLSTVDSTNDYLVQLARQGAPEGRVILANQQTFGQRRGGSDFLSPPDIGLYMSVLLRPEGFSAKRAIPRFTALGAVAVCEAIEEVCGKQAAIRYTNDVQVDGERVCGVLTLAGPFVVVGIGVYVYPQAEGAAAGWVSAAPSEGLRNRLAAAILDHLMEEYRAGMPRLADKFRARSLALGKNIRLLWPVTSGPEKVMAIDEDCRLVLQRPDGEIEKMFFGEIEIIS